MAQLVRASPCHGEGRRFESDLGRFITNNVVEKYYGILAQLAEQLICNQQVIGSSPIIGLHFYNAIWMVSRVAKGDRL